MEDISNYEKLREDAYKFYIDTRPIQSPALGEYVHFTAEGFNHVIFKGSRSERERPSQILRYEETIKEFEVKSHKKKIRKSKPVKYWGIIAIIDGRKVKVILRKIGDNGQ